MESLSRLFSAEAAAEEQQHICLLYGLLQPPTPQHPSTCHAHSVPVRQEHPALSIFQTEAKEEVICSMPHGKSVRNEELNPKLFNLTSSLTALMYSTGLRPRGLTAHCLTPPLVFNEKCFSNVIFKEL